MARGQTIILAGPYQRRLAQSMIGKAPDGAVVNIKAPARTLDQNALLWAALSDISRAMPEGRRHTPDVWKALFMQACGHAVQFEVGLDGQPFPVGFRSSRMSKAEMADLITFILQYGDEHGVRINHLRENAFIHNEKGQIVKYRKASPEAQAKAEGRG